MSLQYLDNPHVDFNCGTFSTSQQSFGNKGVTIWGPMTTEIYLAPNGGTWTGTFTCTQPKCYQDTTDCNLTFTIATVVTSTNNDVGPITQTFSSTKYSYVNGVYGLYNTSGSAPFYHSRIEGHDVTLTQDLAQATDGHNPPVEDADGNIIKILNDIGTNTITFTNNDTQVGVWIQGLQIVRGYDMLNLIDDMSTQTPPPCQPDNTQSGNSDFATRYDYPCNYEKCGGVSFTAYQSDDHYFILPVAPFPPPFPGSILYPNTTYTWSWTNPSATFQYINNYYNDYVGRLHCLFNFNNVTLCDNNGKSDNTIQASTDDVAIALSLDDVNWEIFYHCKDNYTVALGVDLATDPYLSQYYNDNPGGSNTLYLKVINNPGVNLFLIDGGVGYVNLYRFYQTASLCQTITVTQTTGGTISPGTTTVDYGANQTFTITANQGYSIAHVYVNNSDLGAQNSPYTYTFNTVTAPQTISASFIPIEYQLTVTYNSSQGTVSVSPSGGIYNCGTNVTLTATPNSGYWFSYWEVFGGDNLTNPLTIQMTSNITVQAVFVPLYTLTIDPSQGGYTSPGIGNWVCISGANVQVTEYANYGYAFDYWLLDGNNAGNSNPISVTMTANHTLEPIFSAIPVVQLTIFAEEYVIGWGYEGCSANIYVDGNQVKTETVQVLQGQHTIAAENSSLFFICFANYVWNGSSWVFSADNYSNPQTITVTQNTEVIAYFMS